MDEKRKQSRVPVLLEVLWESATGKYEARTSDISLAGCFIDTIGQVAVGETINFKLRLLSGQWIELRGEVKYELPRFGFGVRFKDLSALSQKHLEALVKMRE
jgi:hypothetical protein